MFTKEQKNTRFIAQGSDLTSPPTPQQRRPLLAGEGSITDDKLPLSCKERGLGGEVFVIVLFFLCTTTFAQSPLPKLARPTLQFDSTNSRSKSVFTKNIGQDSLQATISGESDLKNTVVYNAKDSTLMSPDLQIVELFGEAKVTYGNIILEADYIKLNWKTNEVYAKGTYDTTSKKWVGEPIFEDNGEKYDAKEIRYNFKSRKGVIKGIVTQQGEGNIRSATVKKDSEDNLYNSNAIYTTCNAEHPHFYINSKKLKVIPNKQVISGPFNLVIADVPTPLGLPFGFFPIPKKQEIGTSGFLMPQYGEEPNGRGYYLRGGGYYWAISDRVNLIATTQIYSKGSWGIGLQSSYSTRYRYSGNFNFNYNRNIAGSEIKILNQPRNDFSLAWSHSPVPRGTSSFGASVNLGSNSFNQFNAFETQKYIQNVASSSVQYSKQFGQYGRMGSSVRVNQRFPDRSKVDRLTGQSLDPGSVDAGIDFNGGINQIAPFALKGGSGRWFESFRVGADFNGGISLNNNKIFADTSNLGFRLDNKFDTTGRNSGIKNLPINGENLAYFLKNAQFKGQYSIPISLPNLKLGKIMSITPGISMSGEVFTERYQYTYKGNNVMHVDTIKGANFANQFSMSLSTNTRIYGMFYIRGKRLEAIRHTIIPSLSLNYVPDQSNLYQQVQFNEKGDKRYLNKYRNIGGPQGGIGTSAMSASWSINNLFEAKIRPKADSTGKQFEKISILDNLSMNGNYDFRRDSLRASDIAMSTNARLFKNWDFNLSATFDPYQYVADPLYSTSGRKINRLILESGKGLMRLSNMNFSLSTRFAPKGSDKPKTSTKATPEQLKHINDNPDLYVDFNIPWTLSVSYNAGYSRIGLGESRTVQTLRLNGDFSLTQKWKFVFDTGYDFENKAPSITNLRMTRELHCWEMSFNWTPFAALGSFRASNYSFDLRAKSSILQDLKISRRRSFYDRGGF